MNRRSALLVVVLGAVTGCAGRTTVLVRMAREGEVLPEAPPSPPPPPGQRLAWTACRPWGPPAKELYEPVVQFVRAHLSRRLDDCVRPSDVRAHFILPGVRYPRPKQGLEMLVEPRGIVGSLRMSIRIGRWDAGTFYCLHVIEEHGMRTVVVKEQGGWIK